MPPRDPLTLPGGMHRFDNLSTALKSNAKRPPIGITQGGSSRKSSGAKPAATAAEIRQTKRARKTQ